MIAFTIMAYFSKEIHLNRTRHINTMFGTSVVLVCMVLTYCYCASVEPSHAERPRAIATTICETQDASELRQRSSEFSHKIFNNYLYQSKQLDKMDNDLRFLLNKASGLQGNALIKYLRTYVIPKNSDILFKASLITSQSSAIRELNNYYMACANARGKVLNCLVQLASYKVPATYLKQVTAFSVYGCAAVNYFEFYQDEHVPYEARILMAELRSELDDLYLARNTYLNRRAYIERNQDELITEGER